MSRGGNVIIQLHLRPAAETLKREAISQKIVLATYQLFMTYLSHVSIIFIYNTWLIQFTAYFEDRGTGV